MKPQAFGLYSVQDGKLSQQPKMGADPFIQLAKTWQNIHRAQISQSKTIHSLFTTVFSHSKRRLLQAIK